MLSYKLLTPGPLTTTDTVKRSMLFDHCTWDNEYKNITQDIRKRLLELANASEDKYTSVLMQGSGTFGVESVLTSTVKEEDKILIITNGSYGKRMVEIAKYIKLNYVEYEEVYSSIPSALKLEEYLLNDPSITHVAMVHCETTSGILNDIYSISEVVSKYNKTFILDAMSSFGGIYIDIEKNNIDYLVSSSNKCIQGVPGFSFIIANKEKLSDCKGVSRSLSLDLYAQWEEMEKDGKWRFTSPTHTVLAFSKALEELKEEGSVEKRELRYSNNNRVLREGMSKLGIKTYIDEKFQSPIITTFLYPKTNFSFEDMYDHIKRAGYAIYPGKVTQVDTFRIGNIGDITEDDMNKLIKIVGEYLELI